MVVVEFPASGAPTAASGVPLGVDSSAGGAGAVSVADTTARSATSAILAAAGSSYGEGSKTPLAATSGSFCACATFTAAALSKVAPTRAAPTTAAKIEAVGRSAVTCLIYSGAAAFVPPPGAEPADVPPPMTTPMPVALLTFPPLMVTPGARTRTSLPSTPVVPWLVVIVEPL
jgi:hypothetical protein